MERTEIIKALECCSGIAKCIDCPYAEIEDCAKQNTKDTIALIKELTEEKEKLGFLIDEIVREKRELFEENKGLTEEKNKIFEAGARRLSNLELSYLTLEAENANLTEENERLREEKVVALRSTIENAKANARADTVRKMQALIENESSWVVTQSNGIVTSRTYQLTEDKLDQIAEEIIGGSYGKKD